MVRVITGCRRLEAMTPCSCEIEPVKGTGLGDVADRLQYRRDSAVVPALFQSA